MNSTPETEDDSRMPPARLNITAHTLLDGTSLGSKLSVSYQHHSDSHSDEEKYKRFLLRRVRPIYTVIKDFENAITECCGTAEDREDTFAALNEVLLSLTSRARTAYAAERLRIKASRVWCMFDRAFKGDFATGGEQCGAYRTVMDELMGMAFAGQRIDRVSDDSGLDSHETTLQIRDMDRESEDDVMCSDDDLGGTKRRREEDGVDVLPLSKYMCPV